MSGLRHIVPAALLALSFTAAGADGSTKLACNGTAGFADSFEGRRTFLWQPDRLERARSSVQAGGLSSAKAELIAAAEQAMSQGPYTVTAKARAPASGDLHDYTSLGPYWWPDPSKPDGRPYVRRDGRFNPERDGDDFDLTRLESMSRDVQSLSLAYFITGEQRYAAKAASLVRTWFIATESRMNPNLAHAQSIPGRVAGRAEGIIDAHRLVRVVESIGLLEPSGELGAQESARLKAWFGALVEWMATSAIGRAEREKNNNHGVYYDALISHFALFAGNEQLAERTIRRAGARRLRPQIGSNGGMPGELKRTRSLHYTTWTLTAMMNLADLGNCVGVDVWNYPSPDRPLIRTAVDFLVPYVGSEHQWPWPELDRTEHSGIQEVLIRAGWAWQEPSYIELAARYSERYRSLPRNVLLPAFPDD